ncbi:glycosyltransferase [Robertmurraya yapensis]|uniref:Glycosyltransferase n=2 Tax=Bacillaceae TaxID=186817 RepID=A0A3S0KMD2_9BACI|nr:glycosyltransferase family 2 protein [Bacillus yapensis]RTR30009.1 glycosyltransferase [Bacillus yapensis]TKS95090.1 glycosyltransferase [Bacillus yapensis]
MAPKVSVIVPIYKVEKYIHQCVKSIVNQTYPNLEIILVNDGSPDHCGKIAEQYAEQDNRVTVIHKENGGLSDARNAGTKYVTGEYTLFVDSDDWLALDMIEKLVNISLTYQADVVQSAFYYAFEQYLLFDHRYFSKTAPPLILDNQSLMFELVTNEKVKNFAWGKLYKSRLIQDIPFKKGVLFEDVFWAHQVMQRVNTYVLLHEPYVYYRQRSDSIVATYTPRNLDILKGLIERHFFIEKHYKDLTNDSYKMIFKTSLQHYYLLLANWNKDRGGIYRKEIQSYIRKNYTNIKRAVESDKQLSKQLFLFSFHPCLNMIFILLRKVLRKLRVIPQPVVLEKISF